MSQKARVKKEALTQGGRKRSSNVVSGKTHEKEKVSEVEFVREAISNATGVTFEVVPPHPAFPHVVESLEWFMRCRKKEEIAKSPHLNVAWKDRTGIWLESLAIGDTIDWIELAYGEERAGASIDLDYSHFEELAFQDELNQRYPIVMDRIREYEKIVATVSKTTTRTHLELRRAGTRGMLVFTIAARVDAPKDATLKSLRSAIERNVSALKEAYEEIAKPWGTS